MARQVGNLIYKYGNDILQSEEFQKAFGQTHHKCMTVAEHSLGVAVVSLRISQFLYRLHIPVKDRTLIIAALCHDLGILGRTEKYRNNFECYGRHPLDSLPIIREIIGEEEYDEIIEDSVRRHMWPLTPIPPRHREGLILTTADKVSAVMERVGRSPARTLDLDQFRSPCEKQEAQHTS